jgi:hypothetical protein
MKIIREPEAGHPIRASHIKDLVEAVRELQNIRVGPGLVMHQGGGVTIGLQFPRGRGRGKAESCSRSSIPTWKATSDPGNPLHILTDGVLVPTDLEIGWIVRAGTQERTVTALDGLSNFYVDVAYSPPLAAATVEIIPHLWHTQAVLDVDTWAKGVSPNGVTLRVITDVQYLPASHKLQFRTRTLKFDSCGKLYEVTAESDLVDITTAEECP